MGRKNKKKGTNQQGKKPRRIQRFIVVWMNSNLYLANDNPDGPLWTSNPPEAFHFPTRQRASRVLKKIRCPERARVVPRMIERDFIQ